jgi:hypothetical protein
MKYLKTLSLTLLLFGISQTAFAGTVKSCESQNSSGSDTAFDYGDAPASYGSACNDTAEWQRLGSKWDTDAPNQTKNADNSTDDGVTWRVKNADGSWSRWNRGNELTQGQEVEFRFKVTRAIYGTHEYDLLKAWFDWNGNGVFDNTDFNSGGDTIIESKWYKDQNFSNSGFSDIGINKNASVIADGKPSNNDGNQAYNDSFYRDYGRNNTRYYWNDDLGKYNSRDTTGFFVTKITIPLTATLGETWLRARVVCENSLTSHSVNDNLLPTGYQHQGETEDYRVTIAAKKVDVSEPSTLAILAIALLGFANSRRKKQI